KLSCADPQSGTRMRPMDPMAVADQQRIRDWIAQGAPRGLDPDPSTPTIASEATTAISVPSGGDLHYKINVPAGATVLSVLLDGPPCGANGCAAGFNVDLYVRQGQRATDTAYDCRPYRSDNVEVCNFANPSAAWWYVRVRARNGSGDVSLIAAHNAGDP